MHRRISFVVSSCLLRDLSVGKTSQVTHLWIRKGRYLSSYCHLKLLLQINVSG